jgi:hypothetical protein
LLSYSEKCEDEAIKDPRQRNVQSRVLRKYLELKGLQQMSGSEYCITRNCAGQYIYNSGRAAYGNPLKNIQIEEG